jgi:uncharacterized membrane protein
MFRPLVVGVVHGLAGSAAIALLVAVFPANIQMAINGFTSGASPLVLALLLARLPLQPALIWLVYRCDSPMRAASRTHDLATHA